MGDLESHNYEIESEDHISFITRNAVPKAVTLSEVESATAMDPLLQAVISAMKSGCWCNPYENSGRDAGEIRAIKSLADERYRA